MTQLITSTTCPFHDLIGVLNEAMDWLDFVSSGIVFQKILPLKTTEFNPFITVLALGSYSRSFAPRS